MADKQQEHDEMPYGFGTVPAFEAILKRFEQHQIPTTGLVLINLDTLVRNACNPDWKIQEVVDKIIVYMTNMSNDFATVCARWPERHHHIIFYHAAYPQMVPMLFRRIHNGPSAIQGREVLAKLLERLKEVKPQTINGVTSMIALSNDIKQPSYKGLADLCNKLASPAVTIHMLSHNPVDWHITKYGRSGLLYRSHTGAVIKMTPNDLGPIVFEEKGVPFYPATHVMLGDKTMIKGVAARGDRKKFVDIALRDRFVLRSESWIKGHAVFTKSFIPYKFD